MVASLQGQEGTGPTSSRDEGTLGWRSLTQLLGSEFWVQDSLPNIARKETATLLLKRGETERWKARPRPRQVDTDTVINILVIQIEPAKGSGEWRQTAQWH